MTSVAHAEFLKSCLAVNPLIRELPDPALSRLASSARVVTYRHGSRIISRDDEMTFSAVVLSGGIRNSLTNLEGYEFSMSILGRGALYGVAGMAEPTPSLWDCYAHGPTELVRVGNADIRAAAREHPELSLVIARSLSYRLRKAYTTMHLMLLENLDRRLRRTLIMLMGENAHAAGDARTPRIEITQEMLGHFVQCSRPSVNKALRDLERQGIVEIGYGTVRIIDVDALREPFEGETILTL